MLLSSTRKPRKNQMSFQKNKDDVKRTNVTNVAKPNIQDDRMYSAPKPVTFGVTITSSVPHVTLPPKPKKERFVKHVSKKKFVPPSGLELYSKDKMALPLSSFKTKTNTEIFVDSFPNEMQKNFFVFPKEKMESVVEKVVEKVVHKCMKTQGSASKDEIQRSIQASLKGRIEEYLKTMAPQKPHIDKKDLEAFIYNLVKDRIEFYGKNSLKQEDVMRLIETQLKNQTKTMATKDHVTCQIKTQIGELVQKKELMDLVKNFVSSEDVIKMTKDYVSQKELSQFKVDVIHLMDEKIQALDMKSLVEQFTWAMIHDGEEGAEGADFDEPKTRFEKIIEPAVARIIHRVMAYDQIEEVDAPLEGNVEWNHDDVYDGTKAEENHFRNVDELNRTGIDNPMYTFDPTPKPVTAKHDEEQVVELGSLYKKEEVVMYQNELRTGAHKNRRWTRFGNGVEAGSVIDIFLDKQNRKIYIAGHFKHVNRVPMENIAVYDMNIKQWKHVGEGIPQVATSIAVDEENERVFVGGLFSKVGKGENEIEANNIAMFCVKENKWHRLCNGLNRDCTSIVYDSTENKLYAGGSFTHSGSKMLRYVGVYDFETQEWSGLPGGTVNGACRILVKPNADELYLGGLFTHADNENIHVSYIAKYHLRTHKWSSLSGGLQGYCNAISYDSNHQCLYVGGTFTNVGTTEKSIDAHHVAKYDMNTQKWDNMDGGLNNIVQSIFYDDTNDVVYVGGTFTQTFEDGMLLNYIAKYDPNTSKWHSLENHFSHAPRPKEDEDSDNIGLNGVCKMISMDNKSLFIAGKFQIAGNITANSIARYALNS